MFVSPRDEPVSPDSKRTPFNQRIGISRTARGINYATYKDIACELSLMSPDYLPLNLCSVKLMEDN